MVIILILIASLKKLFKLVLVLIFILVIYTGHLIYTGEDPEDILESFKQTGAEAKELIEEKVNQEKKTSVNSKSKKKKKNRFQQQEDKIMKKFKENEEKLKPKFEELEKKIGD